MKTFRAIILALAILTPALAWSVAAPSGLVLGPYRVASASVGLTWTDDPAAKSWEIYVDGARRFIKSRSQVIDRGATLTFDVTGLPSERLPFTITMKAIQPGAPISVFSAAVVVADSPTPEGSTPVVTVPGNPLEVVVSGTSPGAASAVTIIANTTDFATETTLASIAANTDPGGAYKGVSVTVFPDNEPFDLNQVGGNAVDVGSGTVGTGTLRVSIATDDVVTVTGSLTTIPGEAYQGVSIQSSVNLPVTQNSPWTVSGSVSVDGTVATTQSGAWTVSTIPGGANAVTIIANTTDFATETTLASIATNTSPGGAYTGVSVTAALPAGSNTIGGVTQSGIWNVTTQSGEAYQGVSIFASSATQAVSQNSPWTVSGSVSVTGSLPAGSNSIGTLGANSGVDIGDVTIDNASIPVTQSGAWTVTTTPPAGGVAANAVTIIANTTDFATETTLASIAANTNPGGAYTGVSVTAALPAGSNVIGNVGLETGTNSIGTVGLDAGVNSIGTLGANSGIDIGDVTVDNAGGGAAVNIQDGGNSITIDGTIAATQSGTWNVTTQSGNGYQGVSLTAIGSTAVAVDQGIATAGTQRVSIATDDVVQVGDNGTSLTVDGSVSVTGAIPIGTNSIGTVGLDAGSNSIGTLGANSGVDIGDVTLNNASLPVTQSGVWNVTTQSGNAYQGVSVFASSITQAVSQNSPWTVSGSVSVTGSLPAGTNALGDVTVDNGAAGAAVNIQDGGNSLTVDGTVAATQSGVWSVTTTPPAGGVAANAVTIIANTTDFATETTLASIASNTDPGGAYLGVSIVANAIDFATQTTLAIVSGDTTSLDNKTTIVNTSDTRLKSEDGSAFVHVTGPAGVYPAEPTLFNQAAPLYVAFANATVGARVVIEPHYNEFDYFQLTAVSSATGVLGTSYQFLDASVKNELVIDCSLCDGNIFYVMTESATPPPTTLTLREVLTAGSVRVLDNPATHIHWYWSSGPGSDSGGTVNTVTPTAKIKAVSPYLTGISY